MGEQTSTREDRLKLFNENMALAYAVAARHWGYSKQDHEDIEQEALIALWRATETYDPEQAAFTTYAGAYIYHSLTKYAKVARFGQIGRTSYFAIAIARVREARAADKPLERVLDEHNDTAAIRTYSAMVAKGEGATISLNAPLISGYEDSDTTVGDVIADPRRLEDAICEKLYNQYVLNMFDTLFADKCIQRGSQNKERRERLMGYYKARIFGTGRKIPQQKIAKELGMSRNSVSLQFQRWDKQLKKVLLQHMELNVQ